jgi:hypothetical protein
VYKRQGRRRPAAPTEPLGTASPQEAGGRVYGIHGIHEDLASFRPVQGGARGRPAAGFLWAKKAGPSMADLAGSLRQICTL